MKIKPCHKKKKKCIAVSHVFGEKKSAISILMLNFMDLTLIETQNFKPQLLQQHLQRKPRDSQISRTVEAFNLTYTAEAWSLTPLLLYWYHYQAAQKWSAVPGPIFHLWACENDCIYEINSLVWKWHKQSTNYAAIIAIVFNLEYRKKLMFSIKGSSFPVQPTLENQCWQTSECSYCCLLILVYDTKYSGEEAFCTA